MTEPHRSRNKWPASLDEQKTRLKTQRADELLQTLYQHLEGAGVNDSDAPVRQCRRYLNHRREQLNYQSALVHDLPIAQEKSKAPTATSFNNV